MSRVSRVPYHQNVYDLLQLEPGVSPEAARLIAEHEAKHGPLPASVREWYLVPKVVPLKRKRGVPRWAGGHGTLWFVFSNADQVLPLTDVLRGYAKTRGRVASRFVEFLCENQGVVRWWIARDGSSDPPVWVDNDDPDDPSNWTRSAPSFSKFVFDWFVVYGFHRDCQLIKERGMPALLNQTPEQTTAYANGFWLRTPEEPFQPPVIDFLIDQFGEPERTSRRGKVTNCTYHPPGGTIRITADDPALTGGLSAWWIHAETAERLAEFARLLLPWGTLRDTLRADTDPAREVLHRVRGS